MSMGYNCKGKRVFISGPMTGRPDWNRAEFDRVERELRELGAADIFSPASIAPPMGCDAMPHSYYMARTLNVLTRLDGASVPARPYYDAVALLDGWWQSDGARVERAVAEAMGIDIVEWDEPEYL